MYLKILEGFLLRILFNRGEYNIASKHFNPVKFTAIMLLVLNVPLTIFLMVKFNKFYLMVEQMCPKLLS